MNAPIKVILQIPCYNEEHSLPITYAALKPILELTYISGKPVDIETLIIDDGSTDKTIEIARSLGINHIVKLTSHKGLATGWKEGILACLALKADVIVNLDADNQYCASHLPNLIGPVIEGRAEMVIGARDFDAIPYFSPLKRLLQRMGSWFVSKVSGLKIQDATSGYRAYSAKAASLLNVFSKYTYTLETILHAGDLNLTVLCVPVTTNDKLRESRLLKSNWSYIKKSLLTISRIFLLYNPLLCFSALSILFAIPAVILALRFICYYFSTGGAGMIQSLILCAILSFSSLVCVSIGILAHLVGINRRLLERIRSNQLLKHD